MGAEIFLQIQDHRQFISILSPGRFKAYGAIYLLLTEQTIQVYYIFTRQVIVN